MNKIFIKKYCEGCRCSFFYTRKGTPARCLVKDVPLAELSACPSGKGWLQDALRMKRARRWSELSPGTIQLLHDLRTGLVAGIVSGLICIIFKLFSK